MNEVPVSRVFKGSFFVGSEIPIAGASTVFARVKMMFAISKHGVDIVYRRPVHTWQPTKPCATLTRHT